MSGFQDLKELFRRRLLAAVFRDTSGQTTTTCGYEEELHRQRKLLGVILTPEIKLHRADVQQLLVCKEELPPEQEWSHILDQEDTKPQHIKEEHEEMWISQLQGLEEADTTKFPFTPVSVKSEEDEEKPQSSQLHHRQTEQMETGADGEDCGGAEPERDSDPERRLQLETEVKSEDSDESETEVKTEDSDNPETEVKTEDSDNPETEVKTEDSDASETEVQTEDSDEPETDFSNDWHETKEHLTDLNFKNKKIQSVKRPVMCLECGKTFTHRGNLNQHMFIHTGEKPFSCSECGKSFTHRGNLNKHMFIHTGEKPFRCSECGKMFISKGQLTKHMLVHSGEKLFSCSECGKSFIHRGNLNQHMLVHSAEKPFSCSKCDNSFRFKGNLTRHMFIHTGEKPFR